MAIELCSEVMGNLGSGSSVSELSACTDRMTHLHPQYIGEISPLVNEGNQLDRRLFCILNNDWLLSKARALDKHGTGRSRCHFGAITHRRHMVCVQPTAYHFYTLHAFMQPQ